MKKIKGSPELVIRIGIRHQFLPLMSDEAEKSQAAIMPSNERAERDASSLDFLLTALSILTTFYEKEHERN